MFEQDVAGLIKALRANKNDEQGVIDQALDECRQEIRSSDIEIKAAAVLKLVYLEMLGQSIGFASFAIVECMSSTKFHIKTIGYLAASQSFTQDTEVALLVVNLVKKDLSTPATSTFTSSATTLTIAHLHMVLSALSTLLTPTLARDLAPDLLTLLSHSRASIRKQAILLLWKIARSWPGVVDIPFPRSDEDPWIGRLRERLEDEDMSVVGATVNLVCELARKDPKTYLPLAPELFGLLTGGTNNWMLIKIVKLFAVLTPHEPRLVRKLVPPLTELIETTPAMSLLYECIQTSIVGGMLNGAEGEALASTCVDKLHTFLEDVDQNLRYIALLAMHKILPTHPHLVVHEYDTVMACLDDPDLAIRMRALSIVEGMVNRDTLEQTVDKFTSQLNPPMQSAARSLASARPSSAALTASATTASFTPAYKRAIVSSIVRMCSADTYAAVTDFEWYIDTIISLAWMTRSLGATASSSSAGFENHDSLGAIIKNALIDVSARVKAIRPYAVSKCDELIHDESFLESSVASHASSSIDANESDDACLIAEGAAWVVGEYCTALRDPRPTIAALFAPSSSSLPAGVTTAFLHNGTKVYATWLDGFAHDWDPSQAKQIKDVTTALQRRCEECAGRIDRAGELAHLYGIILSMLDSAVAAAPSESQRAVASDPTPQNDEDADSFPNPFAAPSDDNTRSSSTTTEAPRALGLMKPLFDAFPLNPVNVRAQSMVAVPSELDLDVPSYDVPLPSTSTSFGIEGANDEVDDFGRPLRRSVVKEKEKKSKKSSSKGTDGVKKSKKSKKAKSDDEKDLIDVDSIPIVQLDLDGSPNADAELVPAQARRKKKTVKVMEVDVEGELPEGASTPASVTTMSATTADKSEAMAPVEDGAADDGQTVTKVVVKKKKRKEGGKKGKSEAEMQ